MKYVTITEDTFKPLMGNVTCGQFFKHKGHFCLRTSSNSSGSWEAYDFTTQDKIVIPHTDRVTMVDCEINYKYIENSSD